MLGTAGDTLLSGMVRHIVDLQAAAVLADFDAALHAGVDAALLVEQLFGYFRDCMAAAAGCTAESFLYVAPSSANDIVEAGKKLGLQTILAVMQILDQTLSRMRYSTQGRILAELALVRICNLEDLDELPALIAELRGSVPTGGGTIKRPTQNAMSAQPPQSGQSTVKKNIESAVIPPVLSLPPASSDGPEMAFTPENAAEIWDRALSRLSGMAVEHARQFDRLTLSPPDGLVISFKPGYAVAKTFCERPEQVVRFEQALAEATGRRIRVEFIIDAELSGAGAATPAKPVSQHQMMMEISKRPMIQRAAELFGASPTRVEPPN
jgi:DNA polymerase III subunit gamma/tau